VKVKKKITNTASYKISYYSDPYNGKLIDHIIVQATDKKSLHSKIRDFMNQKGLDPDDEDDQSLINVISVKK
jgi:hypothetical protein